jgi:hypothetical protein
MDDERDAEQPDASDVVEGPVGDATIKDPSVNPGIGADLDELAALETDAQDDAPERARPTGL